MELTNNSDDLVLRVPSSVEGLPVVSPLSGAVQPGDTEEYGIYEVAPDEECHRLMFVVSTNFTLEELRDATQDEVDASEVTILKELPPNCEERIEYDPQAGEYEPLVFEYEYP